MDAVIESLSAWEAAPASVERTPALETAIQGWFFFIEGAVLRWLERRDMERDELRELLGRALIGSLQAAEAVGASSYGAACAGQCATTAAPLQGQAVDIGGSAPDGGPQLRRRPLGLR